MSDPARPLRAEQPLPYLEQALETPENVTNEGSDLRAFLALFRRHAVLIGVVTILTGVIAYVVTKQETPQYSSTAQLLFTEPANAPQGFDPARAVSTFVGEGTSSAVLDPVAKAHGMTPAQLRKALSITGNPSADLISVTAGSGSSSEAASLAQGVAQGLINYTTTGTKQSLSAQIASLKSQLQTFAGRTDPASVAAASALRVQLAQAKAQLGSASSSLSVLSPATVPSSPSSPHPARDAGIALLAGLVLALMLAAVRDRLDRRMREIEDVEAVYHAPTLGVVPFAHGRKKISRSAQVADFSGAAPLADAYRTIRTNLTLMETHDGSSAIVVTSAVAGEGKSAVTANLAQALSVTGRRVLAISADLHNPALHKYFPGGYQESDLFGHPDDDPLRERTLDDPTLNAYFSTGYGEDDKGSDPAPESRRTRKPTGLGEKWTGPTRPQGLVPVLAGEVPLDKAVYVIPLSAQERERGGSLHLLADGGTFFDPAALLSSDAMRQLLKEASQNYDAILVDTPPLLANADATLLAQSADTLVLVARLDHLTRNQARRAYRAMTSMRLSPSGIIVTGEVEEGAYGYGYRSNQPLEYDRGLAGDAPKRRASTSTGSS
jgi:Mrp family chromosome partitioning ATPase/capsular polysaccharide biosynthesis protein